MVDSKYLDSRVEINYNSHDEMQMEIIVDKIVDEMKKRYGRSIHLIGNEQLKRLVKHW